MPFRFLLAVCFVALALGGASAQQDELAVEARDPAARRRIVEEIVVTAQKTEQSLRDVPISMTVMDEEFIQQQAITDYRDMMLYAPNAHVDPGNGLFPDINIRGFGSALSNKAFEQAVGLAFDGVPYGRSAYFQGPLFDLDRVEVLRGPQGTFFGKNTTAGLLNITTKRPTDELTGFVSLEYGDLGRQRYEGAVGGPVVPGFLNVRLAGLSDERDGLVRNTTAKVVPDANERMNDRGRQGVRFQLGFPDLLGADLVVSYEHVDIDINGIGWEPFLIPDKVKSFYRIYDPNTDFVPDNFVGSTNEDEYNRNQIDTVVANASYELAGWELHGLAGYSFLRVRSWIDTDFGPAPSIYNNSIDDDPQLTFELRTTSPDLPGLFGLGSLFGLPLGRSGLTAGVFYQDRDLVDSELRIGLNLPVLAQFAAFNNAPEGTPIAPLVDFVGEAVPIGDLGVFDTTSVVEETGMFFDQETLSIAGFAHLNWYLTERWALEYGMRLTQETKEATWDRRFTQGTGAAFAALNGEEFTTTRDRSELAFTPKVAARYDWTDDVNVYATWGRGFRAGGFNEQSFNDEPESLEYETEEADAWEVGTKSRFLGGAANLNLGLYWQNVTGFQVLTLPPNSVATTVVNAGEARARGVELDSSWLPLDWLTLVGTFSFNDSEFLDFPLGQCSFDRPDTDGNGDGRCDHEGQPLFRTPKWQGAVVGSVRYPLASIPGASSLPLLSLRGLELISGLTGEYQDVQYLERTFDERVRQSSFFRFGTFFGFASPVQGWSARIVVENLTDESTDVLIRDVPLGGGNFFKIPEPPRQIFGSFRWSF